jgi:glutaminyl-tRNA synthetase
MSAVQNPEMNVMSYPDEFIEVAKREGKVVTRFPPEPNGHLHLGHVKAMVIDYGFADYANKVMGLESKCILRFDDTNPKAEKEDFCDKIGEAVEWLGYNSSAITYTSDYFDKIFEFAVTLIRNGDAYVCEQTHEEIKESRNYINNSKPKPSPYRNRPVEESLTLFENMSEGMYPENKFTLRMKGDLDSPNPCFWDTVLYRIIDTPHHRTGTKYKIYPMYDISHPIVDSLEGVTHSFCTTEYEIRRDLYYWFLDKLGLRKPYVYEFSRLEVENNTLSKRKILAMINDGLVSGWDDPRLLTVSGLKNRGYTAAAVKKFCSETGITKHTSVLTYDKLENSIRNDLEEESSRRVIVVNPIKVNVLNANEPINCTLYDFPKYMKQIKENNLNDLKEKHKVERHIVMGNVIYLASTDFRKVDDKNYYGLAPNKIVRLKYGPFVKCVSFTDDEINVEIVEPENPKKVKGILNWVSNDYTPLALKHYEILTETKVTAYGEPNMPTDPTVYQFEKYGYYIHDSSDGSYIRVTELCGIKKV